MGVDGNGAELRTRFARDGFLHLKGVFTEEEIARLRRNTEKMFSEDSPYIGDVNGKPGEFALRVNFCSRYPDLEWLLAHPGLVGALRALLGEDFVFLPEMAAHASGYGTWHKDTFSQEREGHHFHWDDDFLMVQTAVYLQDNSASGGGLTIRPGSHMTSSNATPDRLVPPPLPIRAWNFVRRKLRPFLPTAVLYPGSYQIPTKAGDLVLFHFRTDHMASIPKFACSPRQRKFALFFACSANNAHARTYRAFIESRSTYKYLQERPLYTESLRALAQKHHLSLMD